MKNKIDVDKLTENIIVETDNKTITDTLINKSFDANIPWAASERPNKKEKAIKQNDDDNFEPA